MAQNLFIGSLAYATTDDSLKAHFEQIGEVSSARVITDRDSGRSKGFGFVEFTDEIIGGIEGLGIISHIRNARKSRE